MKITIEADAKEIAALANAVQEQPKAKISVKEANEAIRKGLLEALSELPHLASHDSDEEKPMQF